jgi:hypothetical protein
MLWINHKETWLKPNVIFYQRILENKVREYNFVPYSGNFLECVSRDASKLSRIVLIMTLNFMYDSYL